MPALEFKSDLKGERGTYMKLGSDWRSWSRGRIEKVRKGGGKKKHEEKNGEKENL